MPRPTKTPVQRATDVETAIGNLSACIARAKNALVQYGPTDARTISAWETVEQYGAIVHRQSRLLAGKSKGG